MPTSRSLKPDVLDCDDPALEGASHDADGLSSLEFG